MFLKLYVAFFILSFLNLGRRLSDHFIRPRNFRFDRLLRIGTETCVPTCLTVNTVCKQYF
jgi:hypothetical protein